MGEAGANIISPLGRSIMIATSRFASIFGYESHSHHIKNSPPNLHLESKHGVAGSRLNSKVDELRLFGGGENFNTRLGGDETRTFARDHFEAATVPKAQSELGV